MKNRLKEKVIALLSSAVMVITSTGMAALPTFADDIDEVSMESQEAVFETTNSEQQIETTPEEDPVSVIVSIAEEDPIVDDSDISETESDIIPEEKVDEDDETESSVQTTASNVNIATVGDADAFEEAVAALSGSNRVVVNTSSDIKDNIDNVSGVYFDGTYYLSFATEDDLDNAVFCFENFGISYAVEGNARICGTDISYIANAQINSNASTKIAVIDTGSDVANEKYSVISDNVADENGHGTNMANLILGETDDAYIISVKAIGANGVGKVTDICAAVQFAINSDVDVILMALSIRNNGEYEAFEQLIADARSQGITVIASAGNNNTDASKYLPAGIDGVITVGAITDDGYKYSTSNYGTAVNYYIPATSTSVASAIFAGKYIAGNTSGVATTYLTSGNTSGNEDVETIDYIPDGTEYVLAESYVEDVEINDRTNTRMTVRGGGSGSRKLSYSSLFNISSSDDWFTYGYYDVYDSETGHWNDSDEWATANVVYCIEASATNPFGTGNPDYRGTASSNQRLQAALACAPGADLYDLMKTWWATNGSSVLKQGVTDKAMYALAHMAASYAYTGSYSSAKIPSGTFRTVFNRYIAYLDTLHSDPSITGWWCYVYKCQSTSAQQDKNALQLIARAGATPPSALPKAAYAGFTIDKDSAVGTAMTGAGFTVYAEDGTTVLGTITDPDNNGVYDVYTTSESFGDDPQYDLTDRLRLVQDPDDENLFDRTVYLKETTAPTAVGGVALTETITDNSVYTLVFHYDRVDEELTYSIKNGNDVIVPDTTLSGDATKMTSDPIKVVIANTLNSTSFIDGAAISVVKTTGTNFDITSTVFSLYSGSTSTGTALAYARYDATDSAWVWYSAKAGGTKVASAYPVTPGATYTVVEEFSLDAYSSGINYTVVNTNGWTKISDTSYSKTITAGENGVVTPLTATNDRQTVDINIVKTGETSELISNRKFDVTYLGNGSSAAATGTDVVTLTTDSTGKASIEGLPVGWYRITEQNTENYTVVWKVSGSNQYSDSVLIHATVENPDSRFSYTVVTADIEGSYTVNVTNKKPDIETQATETATGSQIPSYVEVTSITDTVSYENLIPGKAYTMYGTLMDANGSTPLLDESGNPYTASTPFTASSTGNGTVEVVFPSVKVKPLAGKTIVVFEDCKNEYDVIIASHAEINDHPQTLFFPEIGTTLTDDATSEHITAYSETAQLTDVVAYENLLPGHYVLVGKLMDKETGDVITNEDGSEVRGVASFDVTATSFDADGNPDPVSGTVDVVFTIDTTKIKGITAVAYEYLHEATITGRLIASHEDIDDVDQTIEIPDIHTTLTDAETGNHTAHFAESVTLIDTVSYEHLIPGKAYVMRGVLMDKATGEPVNDENGNPYEAEQPFTPTAADGTVNVEFTINTKILVGMTSEIVAFETLSNDTKTLDYCIHADINDVDQTVSVPEIHTTATGADGASKALEATGSVTVIDTIEYTGLEVGRTYEVRGTLMKDENTPLTVNGSVVSVISQFTPESADGTTTVTFTFDGRGITGKFVVFEEIYDVDSSIEIAEHKDINDEGQSIVLKLSKTGDSSVDPVIYEIGLVFSCITLLSLGYVFLRKKGYMTDGDSKN